MGEALPHVKSKVLNKKELFLDNNFTIIYKKEFFCINKEKVYKLFYGF